MTKFIDKIGSSKDRLTANGDPSQGDFTTMNCSESEHQFRMLFEPEQKGIKNCIDQQSFEFGVEKENSCASDFLAESHF